MYPTLIGLVTVFAGFVLLLFASLEAMLAFAMYCTLIGGGAAIVVTALGNASIPPASAALAFLLPRAILPSRRGRKPVAEALRVNLLYLVFAVWALAGAMIMPRLFKGRIDVVPLRPGVLRNLYDSFPLAFSSQNITAPVYIIGSVLFAISAFIAVRQPRGAVVFAKAAVVVTLLHATIGWAGVLLPSSVWSVVTAIFRNGTYAQLDQSIGGYERLTGIMPEASAFAAYGFCWFVLVIELWLRDVLPRRTGLAALFMAITLIASTSSTAYVSLAAYAVLLLLRAAIFPVFFRLNKVLLLFATGLTGIAAACSVVVFKPALAQSLAELLQHLTINKVNTNSGLQRAYWARQGFAAFKVSYGLGIGAGSFRSSNLFTAILGSMGIIGVGAWLTYLLQAFAPLRQSTYLKPHSKIDAVGVAAAWAALGAMIPAMLGAPSPDPGAVFSILAGAALGLRQRQPRPVAVAPARAAPDPMLSHPQSPGIVSATLAQ